MTEQVLTPLHDQMDALLKGPRDEGDGVNLTCDEATGMIQECNDLKAENRALLHRFKLAYGLIWYARSQRSMLVYIARHILRDYLSTDERRDGIMAAKNYMTNMPLPGKENPL